MGNSKTVFKYFTIPQYQQEENFLIAMNEKGWRFTNVTYPGFYHFRKCAPGQASYRLDYNQEGLRNKAEYIQMFSDCGWEYICDFVGYSYFRKEGKAGEEREEIFCDDASRLDMMKRVFRGRIIPLIIQKYERYRHVSLGRYCLSDTATVSEKQRVPDCR